ncbi:MAG: DUF4388 domain-containing protein [Polyangiaceae bacterium]
MNERVLVVEGDPAKRELLVASLSAQLPTVRFLPFGRGEDALASLSRSPSRVAIADAAMRAGADAEGPLWQRILHASPHLPLVLLGDGHRGDPPAPPHLPRFARPVSVEALAEKTAELMSEAVFGELHGMPLPSFLQIIEIERKTCTVAIEDGERSGALVFRRGILIHARQGDLAGDAAAIEMFCWPHPRIIVREATSPSRNVVTRLSQLVLEAFRRFDERALGALAGHVSSSEDDRTEAVSTSEPPPLPFTAEELAAIAPGFEHGFVVRRRDGQVTLAAGAPFPGDARRFALAVARAHEAASMASAPAGVVEVVFSGGFRSTLVWRSAAIPGTVIVLVMRRSNAACALAAERLRLRGW